MTCRALQTKNAGLRHPIGEACYQCLRWQELRPAAGSSAVLKQYIRPDCASIAVRGPGACWLHGPQRCSNRRERNSHHGHPPALHLRDAILAPRVAAFFKHLRTPFSIESSCCSRGRDTISGMTEAICVGGPAHQERFSQRVAVAAVWRLKMHQHDHQQQRTQQAKAAAQGPK